MPNYDDAEEESHPSYVMVGFHRCNGNPGPLFGSVIENHHTFITLRVTKGVRRHSLGRDWFHGESRPIYEVNLSSAQFAELLTTMNMGNGVPGTMVVREGKEVPRPPAHTLEAVAVRESFRETVKKVAKDFNVDRKTIEGIIAKKTPLTAAERATITQALEKIDREIRANTPFLLDQFEEATEKVVASAKAEVDSFMTHAITSSGMQALNMTPSLTPPELPEAKK
jgi:hypothetical protein